jgi:hypothetical protein
VVVKIHKNGICNCALHQKIINALHKIRQAVDFKENMLYNSIENSLKIVIVL